MKQLKLTLIALATSSLLLSTTASFAENYKGDYKGEAPFTCPVEKGLKDGFYVGAQVGYDSYRVRQNTTYTAPDVGTSTTPLNATGFVGGAFLGYGQYFSNNFYLAGEGFINGSGASVTRSGGQAGATTSNSYSKFQVNGSAGLSVLPGMKLNNSTLGYLRLGYNWARMKATTTTNNQSASKSNTSGGFNYGLGMETLVSDAWSIRGEYSHTNYNSFSTSIGSNFSPSDNQYMLGLIYHFA